MLAEDESVLAALQAGARGYLLKDSPSADILPAVLAVASNHAVCGSSVADRVMGHLAARRGGLHAAFPYLTDREHEMLDPYRHGSQHRTIARQLFLSDKTVRNHVSSILNKLQAADRSEVIVRAREGGHG